MNPRSPRLNNLPIPLSSFIGREREIADVKRLLATARLITLTGPGGCGKTRLALQVATQLVDAYSEGVWWVELAALSDETLVPQAIAQTLGVRDVPDKPLGDTLAEHLRAKQLLLVLDNCEHLIRACAQVAEQLLQACPNVRILTTSREALRIEGETAWMVPSLSLPDARQPHLPFAALAQYEAVQLFVARAVAVQPSYKLTELNASAVAQLCQRLDGIPLALELAAARVKVLQTAEIAARLDDRFNLLTAGSRTALPRHQTLRAAIDWSYDLLAERERALLRRLSVFAGGCTLEAVEAVCDGGTTAAGGRWTADGRPMTEAPAGKMHGLPSAVTPGMLRSVDVGLPSVDVLDLLARLVDKSLLQVDTVGGETRYHMLETIREYARERLVESAEAERAQNRHLSYFLRLAEDAEPQIEGPNQVHWMNRLEREYDNLRAALGWALESDSANANGARVESGVHLASVLWGFWFWHAHLSEGRKWLLEALAHGKDAAPANRAKALLGAGHITNFLGNFEEASALLEECLSLYRELNDPAGIAAALHRLGLAAEFLDDYPRARTLMEQSLRLQRQVGRTPQLAYDLQDLGALAYIECDYGRAQSLLEEGLALHTQLGHQWGVGIVSRYLSLVAINQDDAERAKALAGESIVLYRTQGDRRQLAVAFYAQGLSFLAAGDIAGARDLLANALSELYELRDSIFGARCIEAFAALAVAQAGYERAARLFGAAETLRQNHQVMYQRANYERNLRIVRERLDADTVRTAWAEGAKLTFEQAVAYALETPAVQKPAAELGTARQRAKSEFGGLTKREREVAALVAQRQSNREIADALVLSERTVESHVAHILNKLGFTARAQIRTWALDKGLVNQEP